MSLGSEFAQRSDNCIDVAGVVETAFEKEGEFDDGRFQLIRDLNRLANPGFGSF